MAKSVHPTYSAADRYERRATRRQRPTGRRSGTRRAVVLREIRES